MYMIKIIELDYVRETSRTYTLYSSTMILVLVKRATHQIDWG